MPRQVTLGLMVRLSPELHAKVKLISAEEKRSLNAEIIYRLEQAYKAKDVRQVA